MYFGSVRFFKHLILLVIVAVILTLSLSLVSAHNRYEKLEKDAARYEEALGAMGYVVPDRESSAPTVENPSFSYQTMFPELYVTPPAEYKPVSSNTVYLTFDGGISGNTSAILDVLKEKGVKATFFIVGSYTNGCESVVKRIVDEGHTLGMRSFSNDVERIYASVESYLSDFDRCFNCFVEITGVKPTVFRFPGGSINSYNSGIYQQIIAETTRRGFTFFDWNVLAQDVYSGSETSMKSNVINGCKSMNGGLVLFHDQLTDADELGEIIDELLAKNYTLAPLTQEVEPVIFCYPLPTQSAGK